MVTNDLWDTIQKGCPQQSKVCLHAPRILAAATEAVLTPVEIVAMCHLKARVCNVVQKHILLYWVK